MKGKGWGGCEGGGGGKVGSEKEMCEVIFILIL